jgi:hypothetical protein
MVRVSSSGRRSEIGLMPYSLKSRGILGRSRAWRGLQRGHGAMPRGICKRDRNLLGPAERCWLWMDWVRRRAESGLWLSWRLLVWVLFWWVGSRNSLCLSL